MLGSIKAGSGVQVRTLVHQAQETPLLAVAYHTPDEVAVEGGQAAIFLDRDGVINRFAKFRRPEDFDRFCQDGAIESIVRLMKTTRLPVYVVSNQQGAGADNPRGQARAEMAFDRLAELVVANGGKFAGILYCPNMAYKGVPKHTVNGHKPHGGMFLEAASRDRLDLARSIMVGDSVKDLLAAKAAHQGMTTVLVKTGHGGKDAPLPQQPEAWAEALPQAVDWIIAQRVTPEPATAPAGG